MPQFTQDNHLISISDFGLGKDALLLTSFEGSESISDLFQFEIEVLSENLDITPDDLIGRSGTIKIQNEHKRVFNGYVNRFAFGEIMHDSLRAYKLTLVPWLWFLSKANNHRIFQEKTVKDIVSQIFRDHGFTDFNFAANGGVAREYCVQHNESDLHFVSRLLEEDGIAYYFKHDQDKHTLHLVDEKNAYQDCTETDLVYSKGNQPNSQISHWEHRYLFRKGQWSLNDYDFKTPNKSLLRSIKTVDGFAKNAQYEHYEYPGYYEYGYRDEVVKIRQDAEELERNTVEGKSDCSTFYAGGKFFLAKHATKEEKGSYLITNVFHKAEDTGYHTDDKTKSSYENHFNCVPADIHYRPKQKHVRPVMPGQQSALVVGPPGEEIYVDEYGRIKVQFFWDREGKKNENSSCFLRVMQVWAGNKWGATFVPRIGHEVIVSFLDGDADKPIVAGSVYNGKNKPPYESKTQSGIKSHSTLNGSANNFNEIRFDDKKGGEELFIQAEKNYVTNVKNDSNSTTGGNASKSITGNLNNSVGGNVSSSIGGNESMSLAGNRTDSVGGSASVTIAANLTENIGADHSSNIGANASTNIGSNQSENVGGKKSINVGSKSTEMVGSVKMTTVGAAYMINVGAVMNEIVAGAKLSEIGAYNLEAIGGNKTVKIGGDLTISVGGKVTISAGGASIVMEGGNVTIKGGVIDLN